jgi:hypothetical protein
MAGILKGLQPEYALGKRLAGGLAGGPYIFSYEIQLSLMARRM